VSKPEVSTMSETREPKRRRDWTVGRNGRTNSSKEFNEAVAEVYDVLSSHRLGGDLAHTARLIVARLAHVRHLAPREPR
jgi:hypothetical protein